MIKFLNVLNKILIIPISISILFLLINTITLNLQNILITYIITDITIFIWLLNKYFYLKTIKK